MKHSEKEEKKSNFSVKSNSDQVVVYEFGGPIGSSILMIWSHCVLLYFWLSFKFYECSFFIPSDFSILLDQLSHAKPNLESISIYFGFIFIQLLFSSFLPGPIVKGLPVPTDGNKKHEYKCNAATSWWVTIILI